VRWATGSCTGRTGAAGGSRGYWGLLTALEEWALPKMRWQWVMWNVGADTGVSEVMAACSGGLKAVLGDSVGLVLSGEGATTLGELRKFTLGLAREGQWFSRRDGGASVHHDSKIS
jgi:hypothetical protein